MNKGAYILNIPIQDLKCYDNIIEKYCYNVETDYECRCISLYFDSKNKLKKFSQQFYCK